MENLLNFLEAKAKEFQRTKVWRKGKLRSVLAAANEEDALHVPENSSPETVAQALVHMAEKSPLGVSGLKEWAANLDPEHRKELTLYEIVELLNPNY